MKRRLAILLHPRPLSGIVYRAAHNGVLRHDGVEHAGYLAFLALLAMFPFLVLLVMLAGMIGQGELGSRFIELLFANLPGGAVTAIRPRVEEIVGGPPQGILGAAIIGAIWTSSSMLEGLRTILNRAYHVHTPPAYWFRRLLSILQLLVILGVVLIVMTLVVTAPLVIKGAVHLLGLPEFTHEGAWWGRLIFLISAGVIFLIVANLYWVLPNIKQSASSVIPGAVVVTILWFAGAWAFSAYLNNFHQVNLIYGSIGGFVATLLFFYLSNIIFIFGAELNYEIKIALGEKIEEKEEVVPQMSPSAPPM